MLNLYCKATCPYCGRVFQANETIKAPLIRKDVRDDPALLVELVEKGGKRQVPFLEDTVRGVSMYDSLAIIEYLRQHYGNGADVQWDEVGNVCPID